jgi:hypothetical protein
MYRTTGDRWDVFSFSAHNKNTPRLWAQRCRAAKRECISPAPSPPRIERNDTTPLCRRLGVPKGRAPGLRRSCAIWDGTGRGFRPGGVEVRVQQSGIPGQVGCDPQLRPRLRRGLAFSALGVRPFQFGAMPDSLCLLLGPSGVGIFINGVRAVFRARLSFRHCLSFRTICAGSHQVFPLFIEIFFRQNSTNVNF